MTDWKEVFTRLEKKLSRALDLAGNTHTLQDLRDKIADGRLKCFFRDDAMILCEIFQYPQCRAVNFFMAAGKLDSVLMIEPIVIAWAKANGCDRAYLGGRAGWQPVLEAKDWHPSLRMLEKRF